MASTPRIRLTPEEYELIQERRQDHKALAEECEANGIPIEAVNYYWHKSKRFSLNVKGSKAINYFEVRDELIAEMKAAAPVYPKIERPNNPDNHLLIVDPADVHFGKYSTISETGELTTVQQTEKRFSAGIDGLIQKTSGYNLDKIVYVGGNDVLHTDNPFGTTTSGTRQDINGLWYEHFWAAKKATITAIDKLLAVADVHFVFCPSNHDFMTGFFLSDSIMSWYANNPNITFDVTPMHRKYFQYGYNLIGATHGDGAKENDLSDLIKIEAKRAYSLSKYVYWLVHHVHHKDKKAHRGSTRLKLEKDHRNVTVFNTGYGLEPEDYCFVEYIRSISGTDRWHFTNAHVHSPKAMEAFLHHPEYGQVNRITHLF